MEPSAERTVSLVKRVESVAFLHQPVRLEDATRRPVRPTVHQDFQPQPSVPPRRGLEVVRRIHTSARRRSASARSVSVLPKLPRCKVTCDDVGGLHGRRQWCRPNPVQVLAYWVRTPRLAEAGADAAARRVNRAELSADLASRGEPHLELGSSLTA